MTTKLILINTDTHVVVPRDPDDNMLTAVACCSNDKVPTGGGGFPFRKNIFKNEYSHAIAAAPQLTTPPVLRWEKPHAMGSALYAGNYAIATVHKGIGKWALYTRVHGEPISQQCDTEAEARRAAEKALGIPFEVEEV